MTTHRSFAVSGLVFVGSILATLGLQGSTQPTRQSSPGEVVDYFTAHAGNVKVSEVICAFGFGALLWWVGGVSRRLRAADDGFPGAATAAVAGLGVAVALILVDISLYTTAAVGVSRLSADSELLLLDLSTAAVLIGGLGLAVFLAATGVLNRRGHFFPAWTDYLGGLTAVAFVIGAVGIATDANGIVLFGYAATIAWLVWVATVSVSMWRSTTTAN